MSPDELRQVATEMRDLAERMASGAPWKNGRGTVQIRSGFAIAGRMGMLASAHIAAWDPLVALAVADLLETAAECREDGWDFLPDRVDAIAAAWRGES